MQDRVSLKIYHIWSFGFHLTFELCHLKLCYCNCIKLTGLITGLTLDTFIHIELMGSFLLPSNRVNRTDSDASPAAGALFRID